MTTEMPRGPPRDTMQLTDVLLAYITPIANDIGKAVRELFSRPPQSLAGAITPNAWSSRDYRREEQHYRDIHIGYLPPLIAALVKYGREQLGQPLTEEQMATMNKVLEEDNITRDAKAHIICTTNNGNLADVQHITLWSGRSCLELQYAPRTQFQTVIYNGPSNSFTLGPSNKPSAQDDS